MIAAIKEPYYTARKKSITLALLQKRLESDQSLPRILFDKILSYTQQLWLPVPQGLEPLLRFIEETPESELRDTQFDRAEFTLNCGFLKAIYVCHLPWYWALHADSGTELYPYLERHKTKKQFSCSINLSHFLDKPLVLDSHNIYTLMGVGAVRHITFHTARHPIQYALIDSAQTWQRPVDDYPKIPSKKSSCAIS